MKNVLNSGNTSYLNLTHPLHLEMWAFFFSLSKFLIYNKDKKRENLFFSFQKND